MTVGTFDFVLQMTSSRLLVEEVMTVPEVFVST